jgi:DNA segregation ATPase FtsK/SpoIIIE, S-DNA-T family
LTILSKNICCLRKTPQVNNLQIPDFRFQIAFSFVQNQLIWNLKFKIWNPRMATNVQKPNSVQSNNSLANEIVAIALFAVSVLLLLCLFTYNPNDPSINTASREATQNFIGTIGANIATLLFQAIGLPAFVVPVLLVWAAWQCFWSESLYVPVSRIVGFVLFVVCLSALLPLFGFVTFFDRSVPAGGLVGTLVSGLAASGLGTIGATILFLAAAAVAFLLVTGVSYAPLLVQLKIW